MPYPNSSWANRQLYIVIEMILSLPSMIGFLQVHMSIFGYDTISHPDVGLHRSERIFLLYEVDADVTLPVVGAGFIEDVEVGLLAERF